MEREDRALIRRQAPEGALELVAIVDRQDVVLRDRRVRKDPDGVRPSALTAQLGIAGMHEDPVQPSGESIGIAERGQVLPGSDDGLLDSVLGSVDVAKDPERDRHEPITSHARQAGECFLIAVLCELYECPLHPIDPSAAASLDGTLHLRVAMPVIGSILERA